VKAFNTLLEAVVNPGSASGYRDVALATIVPAGKQLVVEFVSKSSEMPPGQKPHPVIVILNSVGSAVVQRYPVSQFQLKYSGADIYKSADPARRSHGASSWSDGPLVAAAGKQDLSSGGKSP
jgi:hypothetical protein